MKKSEQRQLDIEWQALLKRHSKPLDRGAKSFGVDTRYLKKSQTECNTEVLQKIRSMVTPGGDTSLPPKKEYTGVSIIGIATMHKSNLVPIFSKDEAVATASMRR